MAKAINSTLEFKEALSHLVGRRCWDVSFDPPTTFHQLILAFEPQVRRVRPIANDMLPPEVREFAGAFELMAFGDWYLRTSDSQRSWSDVSEEDLLPAVGQTVTSADLDETTFELTVDLGPTFAVGLRPATIRPDSPDGAYTLFAEERVLTVTRDRTVLVEPRTY